MEKLSQLLTYAVPLVLYLGLCARKCCIVICIAICIVIANTIIVAQRRI